jgi:hypothetical protein
MISAVVLAPDMSAETDLGHAREIVVRSLVWLVSAVVSGVVRDVILAVPEGFGLAEVADQAGCMLVEADGEGARLSRAVAASRETRVLVLRTGFQPEAGLVEEIDSFLRRAPRESAALVLATPDNALQRLAPDRAPIVGILASREAAGRARSFAAHARASRKGHKLRGRAARIA